MIQNGEIYNYRSLKDELLSLGHCFHSNSDTEVLVHGYEEWGIEDLLLKIDGMFAFAVVDENQGVLHLVRDRFGEKPLYLHFGQKVFGFASNIKALMKALNLSQEIDPLSLVRYLALHYVPGRRTIFREINRLLPGERMEVSLIDGTCKGFSYYQMLEPKKEVSKPAELEFLMRKSVESRLVSDVPVGVFLSGGLDSSFLTSLAAKKMPSIKTFSIGFDSVKHDESHHAKLMAKRCGVDHHEVDFKERDFACLLPEVASILDEPLGDPAALPTLKLCKEASRFVKVVLTGEGADELFGGYSYYKKFSEKESFLKKIFGRRSCNPIQGFINHTDGITPSGFPLVANKEVLKLLNKDFYSETNDKWELDLLTYLDNINDPLRRACATDTLSWLPDNLLVKLDRMTMSMGLEGRCPFLERDLAEYAFGLPSSKKINGKETKVALRSIGRKSLPRSAWKRKKQGFVLPMAEWLKKYLWTNGGPKNFVKDRNCTFFDNDALVTLFENWIGKNFGPERVLYTLVMFLEWHGAYNR